MKSLTGIRLTASGLLAGCLLLPATVIHAAPDFTGTLVGTISCTAATAAVEQVTISVEGVDISAHPNSDGHFTIVGVPIAAVLTVDAVDPSATSVATRYDVQVNAGETVDIGMLRLNACSSPAPDVAAPPSDLGGDSPETNFDRQGDN
jgi:hypothetical protein